MAKPSHSWPHWFAVWGEIRTSGLSLAEFCRREKLPYDAARKAFKRVEQGQGDPRQSPRKNTRAQWDAWKLEFLAGEFKTVSDFVRSKGLDPGTGYISRMTKGWTSELREIRAKSEAESVAAIADQKGAEAIARLHGRVLTALYQCLSDLEGNGPVRKRLHGAIDNVKDSLDLMRNVGIVVDSLLKVEPAVARIEGTVGARSILKQLAEQNVDVTQTALAFEQMGLAIPESVRILLSKAEAPEPEIPENEIPSDGELERLWREGLARVSRQEEEFLPRRQREIEQLKTELKDVDSFSDDAFGGEP